MDRRSGWTIGIAIVALGIAAGITWFVVQRNVEPSPASVALSDRSDVAPYTDTTGEVVSLANILSESEVVVVNSWASWCPFCVEELQMLNEIANEFAGRVTVVAINRKESISQANRFLATVGELPNIQIVLDPDDRFYRDITGYTMPETIIYNQRGEVVHHQHGVVNEGVVRSVIEGEVR